MGLINSCWAKSASLQSGRSRVCNLRSKRFSLRGRRLKGKGKRVLGARETEWRARRVPLAFLSHLKLAFPSLSNACHAGDKRLEVEGERENAPREGDTRGVSRAPVFSCAHYFHAPAAQTSVFDSATGPILRVWAVTGKLRYCLCPANG